MVGRFVLLANRLNQNRLGQHFLRIILAMLPGLALAIACTAAASERRLIIFAIQRLNDTPARQSAFARAAEARWHRRPASTARLDCRALALFYSGATREAWALVTSPLHAAEELVEGSEYKISALRTELAFELARYRDCVASSRISIDISPEGLRPRHDYLKAAFAASKLRQERDAIEFFGRQYCIMTDHPGRATNREIDKIVAAIEKQTLKKLDSLIGHERMRRARNPSVGVFFLSSTDALGHAILDPFYFLALNRDKFDIVYFIGPPRTSYRAPSRACLQIVEQYGDYIETDSEFLNNLSWMSFGHHRLQYVTLGIDHYWTLLRQAVRRTLDETDPFNHNAWHMTLPPYYTEVAKPICHEAGIDLELPFVVVHVRDSTYHGIAKQSFRDSEIESYCPAIERLLDLGYQVIRVGDTQMPRLKLGRAGYFELPFIHGYRHELDPFLISRATFMIGCQSGPCAFARALAVPLLTINAILHYTLLPATREMACFKRYHRETDGQKTELSLEQALDDGIYHFENSYQFEDAGIVVENASATEIVAAVDDMIVWLDDPNLPETALQGQFRDKVGEIARMLDSTADNLDLPIGDFLGIALPGYRISPTVAKMREHSPDMFVPSPRLPPR